MPRFKMEFYKVSFFFVLVMSLCCAKIEGGTENNNTNPSEKTANSTAIAEKQTYTSSQSTYLPGTQLYYYKL